MKTRAPLPCLKKLPTTFKTPYAFSLSVELVELIKKISAEGVNVSQGAEKFIRKWAVKTARELNKQHEQGVDSQRR